MHTQVTLSRTLFEMAQKTNAQQKMEETQEKARRGKRARTVEEKKSEKPTRAPKERKQLTMAENIEILLKAAAAHNAKTAHPEKQYRPEWRIGAGVSPTGKEQIGPLLRVTGPEQ